MSIIKRAFPLPVDRTVNDAMLYFAFAIRERDSFGIFVVK